jgi:hypothetical protein
MKFSAIKDVVTSKVGRQLLQVQKHSPVLMLGAGIVGVGATVVLASRATLKVQEVLEEHQTYLEKINGMEHPSYSDDDRTKDRFVLYLHTTSKILKLYSPAVIAGLASVSFLVGGHQIQARRNSALMAAYSGLEKAFDKYRKRVVDDMGADKDREYRYGKVDGHYVEKDEKTGEDVRTPVTRVSSETPSGYAKFFDENSTSWNDGDPMYNLMFLKCQQNYVNDRLKAKGHVFLNEVYDALGLERSSAGAVVGWVWQGEGDNYIDFGIFDAQMEPQHLDFFTGRENAILLDFNVDGVIYDKI